MKSTISILISGVITSGQCCMCCCMDSLLPTDQWTPPVIFKLTDNTTSEAVVCQDESVQGCWLVEPNIEALKKLREGDRVWLIDSLDNTDFSDTVKDISSQTNWQKRTFKFFYFESGDHIMLSKRKSGEYAVGAIIRKEDRIYSVEPTYTDEDEKIYCHVLYYMKRGSLWELESKNIDNITSSDLL